jgi:hypothetical protein
MVSNGVAAKTKKKQKRTKEKTTGTPCSPLAQYSGGVLINPPHRRRQHVPGAANLEREKREKAWIRTRASQKRFLNFFLLYFFCKQQTQLKSTKIFLRDMSGITPSPGGIFGSAPSAGASPPAAGGGLFGASPPAAGGMFGASPPPPAAASPASGLFGSAAQSSAGGIFGAAQPAAAAAGGGGGGNPLHDESWYYGDTSKLADFKTLLRDSKAAEWVKETNPARGMVSAIVSPSLLFPP